MENGKEYALSGDNRPVAFFYAPSRTAGVMYAANIGKATMHHDIDTMIVTGNFEFEVEIPSKNGGTQTMKICNGEMYIGPTNQK
jgi:hypothetical protein